MAKNKRNARRGVTLADTVVAMAIITIISIAATSLFVSLDNNEVQIRRDAEIIRYAENVIDCFNWAANGSSETERNGSFDSAMRQELKFLPSTEPAPDGTPDGTTIYRNDMQGNEYRFFIEVNFKAQPYTLKINVTENSGEEIYSFAYEK